MESTSLNRSPGQYIRSLWHPFLWVPLVVLVAGLTVTAFTAEQLANHTRILAEHAYRAQHDALVNRLHAEAVAQSPERQVEEWLASVFSMPYPSLAAIRVDTLERHTKMPLFQTGPLVPLDDSRSLRSEINLDRHHWLITTMPDNTVFRQRANTARYATWTAGTMITAIGVALTLFLSARIHTLSDQLSDRQLASEKLDQQLGNMQVEKSILRQALNDSEQRSRDLVALSGAMIGELDEQGCIGFISATAADWLQRAPADLSETPFEELVAPEHRANFRKALAAARSEKQMHRIDLELLTADQDENIVPATLRILALQDPVHGFAGYRISARPSAATT
ncbi:PAS/PAC sensor protein [Marinobacter lipolyticus SM19]|uniref:PAS/PAC sensor protein n=1 Tax=Marinobacter lipolyticus SM19 TaxID=1318628 RepID=R8AZX5_9GAMM|nr:PAS domain-containing protein [Marinobacter lipolyticus]EON91878.1 PAS/PAC sensor protein [Marinobacter lipolyticus SM19]